MSDMKKYIDRDEFVNRINENVELTDPEEQEWVKDECIRQAHAMPPVNVGEWISVDERLPDGNGVFLVSLKESGYENLVYFDVIPYADGEWRNLPDKFTVSHWMPLPEPPKGE